MTGRATMIDFAEKHEAKRMLEVFGFDGALVRDLVVARAAAASRSYMGGLYPPSASGTVRWIHSVASSREALAPFGYDPDDTDQLSKVIHLGRRVAIVPATGSATTGIPYSIARKYPSTKWPRGERTAVAVARNNQPALFSTEVDEIDPEGAQPLVTWMLLQHATSQEVRSELSRPAAISARGFITEWDQRFILPPLSNDGGPIDEPFEDGDEGIDIAVEPK
jgi:hypothetical protein